MFNDPEYLEPVLACMAGPKPTLGKYNMAVMEACKNQWYTWQAMSPDLPINEERSMYLSTGLVWLCAILLLL